LKINLLSDQNRTLAAFGNRCALTSGGSNAKIIRRLLTHEETAYSLVYGRSGLHTGDACLRPAEITQGRKGSGIDSIDGGP
jgi:hypothetical protein